MTGAPGAPEAVVGFVGLGNMGGVLAANLVATGHVVVAYDAAGAERVPAGAAAGAGVADVARRADVVVCSLPDGADDACARVEPVLAGLSDKLRRVGDRPGLAQAMKLANNFLSATALAATSEAVAFGVSVGLDMATMVEVLNASSGHNTATNDKFPNHVLTGRYASGFSNSLMSKDIQLYLQAVAEQAGPATIGTVTADVWARFAGVEPGADFTRIYPFVEGS
ncbi:MAG: NAD-binding protein [Acidimicrobiia bacterium]